MSAEQRVVQQDAVVSEYQTAKDDLDLIERKLSGVAMAYKAYGSALTESASASRSWFHKIVIENGLPKLMYSGDLDTNLLLNAEALVALLRYRDAAEERMNRAREAIKSLGIANLE